MNLWLSVSQAIQRRKVGWFMSNELERMWKEAVDFTANVFVQRVLSTSQNRYRSMPFARFPLSRLERNDNYQL